MEIVKHTSCQNIYCLAKGTLKCSHCRFVFYCSNSCQHYDWVVHKFVCYPSLSQRLCGLARLQVLTNTQYATLSTGNYSIDLDGLYYQVSAFNGDIGKHFCIVCGKKISYKGPLNDIKVKFISTKVTYYRCDDCIQNDRIICENSFRETGVCRKSICDNIILFHYISNDFPCDIIHVILYLFIQISCCL